MNRPIKVSQGIIRHPSGDNLNQQKMIKILFNTPFILQVSLGIPIVFLMICAFLVFMPFYVEPIQVGGGVVITIIGVPFYFLGVWWKNKPKAFLNILGTAIISL